MNVTEQVGTTAILVDVEPDTLNVSPERMAAAITPRTKCILPVHYAGYPCDMDPIMRLAAENGLYVVEDAAHALPSKYHGQAIGTIGDMTEFSLHGVKEFAAKGQKS